jgi:hypothetical protein
MSVWVVAVASLGWLAVSAAVTEGSPHMLELWALGMLCAYAAFEVVGRIRRYRVKSSNGDTTPIDAPTGPESLSALNPPAAFALTDGPAEAGASEVPASAQKRANVISPTENTAGPDVASGASATATTSSEHHASKFPVVLTAEEAAELLHVRREDLLAAMRAGKVPGNHVADSWRCSAPSLLSWLDGDWPSTSGEGKLAGLPPAAGPGYEPGGTSGLAVPE